MVLRRLGEAGFPGTGRKKHGIWKTSESWHGKSGAGHCKKLKPDWEARLEHFKNKSDPKCSKCLTMKGPCCVLMLLSRPFQGHEWNEVKQTLPVLQRCYKKFQFVRLSKIPFSSFPLFKVRTSLPPNGTSLTLMLWLWMWTAPQTMRKTCAASMVCKDILPWNTSVLQPQRKATHMRMVEILSLWTSSWRGLQNYHVHQTLERIATRRILPTSRRGRNDLMLDARRVQELLLLHALILIRHDCLVEENRRGMVFWVWMNMATRVQVVALFFPESVRYRRWGIRARPLSLFDARTFFIAQHSRMITHVFAPRRLKRWVPTAWKRKRAKCRRIGQNQCDWTELPKWKWRSMQNDATH